MGAFLDKPKTDKSSYSENGDTLRYGLSSMQGWRMDMEDAHTHTLSLPTPFESWSYFGVYDGHAGGVVSELCSKALLPSILETEEFKNMELDKSGDPMNITNVISGIKNGFLNLDKMIGESVEVKNNIDKSGSTAIVVFITPKYIIFANCGDSRGILVRSNNVHFYTDDHKPTKKEERERIHKAGGIVASHRVNGSLAVSRALGDFDYKGVETISATEQMVSPEPEVTIIDRSESEDQILVLACDGIWDVMTNDELNQFILKKCEQVPDLSRIAENVIDHCLNKGSRDNMSLIIVATKNAPQVDEEFLKKLQEEERELFKEMEEEVEEQVILE